MTKTNWKKLINPDYLGAYSLDDGNGKYVDVIATIKYVKVENVTGPDGKKEDCAVAHFEENMKPMILNTTNMKMLEKLFKSKYIEDWAGRKIQIGVEKVKAFGDVVDALRIRGFLPRVAGTAKCQDCSGEVTATEKMTAAQLVAFAQQRFGAPLCAECMRKRNEKAKQETEQAAAQGTSEPSERPDDTATEQEASNA